MVQRFLCGRGEERLGEYDTGDDEPGVFGLQSGRTDDEQVFEQVVFLWRSGDGRREHSHVGLGQFIRDQPQPEWTHLGPLTWDLDQILVRRPSSGVLGETGRIPEQHREPGEIRSEGGRGWEPDPYRKRCAEGKRVECEFHVHVPCQAQRGRGKRNGMESVGKGGKGGGKCTGAFDHSGPVDGTRGRAGDRGGPADAGVDDMTYTAKGDEM